MKNFPSIFKKDLFSKDKLNNTPKLLNILEYGTPLYKKSSKKSLRELTNHLNVNEEDITSSDSEKREEDAGTSFPGIGDHILTPNNQGRFTDIRKSHLILTSQNLEKPSRFLSNLTSNPHKMQN